MSETTGKIRKPPQKLDENKYNMLKNIGYIELEIRAFNDNGTVK